MTNTLDAYAPLISCQYKVNLGQSRVNLGQNEVGVPKKKLEKIKNNVIQSSYTLW
jgi:hypothetical protein